MPPVRAEIIGPGPRLSLKTEYNFSCNATGGSPFLLYRWSITRHMADPLTVSLTPEVKCHKLFDSEIVSAIKTDADGVSQN